MKFCLKCILNAIVILVLISCMAKKVLAQNSENLKVGTQKDGSILVPSNQLLNPAGFQVIMPGRPVDLVPIPGKNLIAVKNKNSLDLIRISDRTIVQSLEIPGSGSSVTGIYYSEKNSRLYLTDAGNRIHTASLDDSNIMKWETPIVLPQPAAGGNSFPGGLAFDEQQNTILVTLSRNNSVALIDMADALITEIPVGIAPFDVVLKSESKAYVTNWGGRVPKEGESTYNSSGSQVLVDPETGIANSGSVSVIDLNKFTEEKSIEVGLHPSGMVFNADKSLLFVACANSDIISVIDTESDEVVEEISVRMNHELPFGSSPNALAISPDGETLYVANGTDNAVCVVEATEPFSIKGYIPTGWYPGSVAVDNSGTNLYVANVKGIGSRNQRTDRKGYNSHDHMGSISIIPLPSEDELKAMTEIAIKNNSLSPNNTYVNSKNKKVAVPVLPGQTSHFKHVVYIIKENRTYDQVFGDMPQGDGDTSLVHFGYEVTPNHHKLAETFILMDNYYCSGILSADGHQWTNEAFVTDYIEKSFGGFTRSYPYDGDDALAYASSGFIWDNVLKNGLTFRNYGEFVNAVIKPRNASFTDIYNDFLNGTKNVSIRAEANLEQLKPYICPTFIGFPNKVPDVYRANEFSKELQEFEKNNNFPNFIIMLLPNDHTSGTRPGVPTPRAAVADNDLALGQIIEAISNSRFWKETCIFVTEDDPQAGLDHIDGHRTVGMVISPYTKRNKVISTYYSQINMVRTMENILGIPPMNQFDLLAEPMLECFTETPDFTPYKALQNNIPLDELNPPLESLNGQKRYWAKKSMEQDLDDYDRIEEDTFNRIIWHATKGYDRPYPILSNK
ncbi:beta-propeller fold lactonase family protein [Maribellus comscasis]|uniref:Beta-propeller fold lactonase family protein n=1 Tax=Maribellus comscasis TaxID=2681766 RepID=A0A6I6JQJ8_9BACT|nr:alkaline phosphatase family protein [Maribellus comscasis]QGY43429.1 beta-propeller fold lactonase family protein [Maribellus comscasis]